LCEGTTEIITLTDAIQIKADFGLNFSSLFQSYNYYLYNDILCQGIKTCDITLTTRLLATKKPPFWADFKRFSGNFRGSGPLLRFVQFFPFDSIKTNG
jgi:hypothetical protein